MYGGCSSPISSSGSYSVTTSDSFHNPHQLAFPVVSPPFRTLGSPYTRVPLPVGYSVGVDSRSGPVIMVNPLLERGPRVAFDLCSGPNLITTIPTGGSSQRQFIPPQVLSEPATHRALRSLTITSRFLPWRIHVSPTPALGYVTVGDVFASLLSELHKPVSEDELASLLAPKERRMVDEAFRRRAARLAGGWMQETEVVRRIDFLMGETRFAGLSRNGGVDQWELIVS